MALQSIEVKPFLSYMQSIFFYAGSSTQVTFEIKSIPLHLLRKVNFVNLSLDCVFYFFLKVGYKMQCRTFLCLATVEL